MEGRGSVSRLVVLIGEQWLYNVVFVSAISLLVALEWLSHVRLFDPMDGSRPDSPVLHFVPQLAQTHVHRAGDFI